MQHFYVKFYREGYNYNSYILNLIKNFLYPSISLAGGKTVLVQNEQLKVYSIDLLFELTGFNINCSNEVSINLLLEMLEMSEDLEFQQFL